MITPRVNTGSQKFSQHMFDANKVMHVALAKVVIGNGSFSVNRLP